MLEKSGISSLTRLPLRFRHNKSMARNTPAITAAPPTATTIPAIIPAFESVAYYITTKNQSTCFRWYTAV